jgi:hypothetical protein
LIIDMNFNENSKSTQRRTFARLGRDLTRRDKAHGEVDKRRQFIPEVKALAWTSGRSVGQVAGDLDVVKTALQRGAAD